MFIKNYLSVTFGSNTSRTRILYTMYCTLNRSMHRTIFKSKITIINP